MLYRHGNRGADCSYGALLSHSPESHRYSLLAFYGFCVPEADPPRLGDRRQAAGGRGSATGNAVSIRRCIASDFARARYMSK